VAHGMWLGFDSGVRREARESFIDFIFGQILERRNRAACEPGAVSGQIVSDFVFDLRKPDDSESCGLENCRCGRERGKNMTADTQDTRHFQRGGLQVGNVVEDKEHRHSVAACGGERDGLSAPGEIMDAGMRIFGGRDCSHAPGGLDRIYRTTGNLGDQATKSASARAKLHNRQWSPRGEPANKCGPPRGYGVATKFPPSLISAMQPIVVVDRANHPSSVAKARGETASPLRIVEGSAI
jgi:hypothetical protein